MIDDTEKIKSALYEEELEDMLEEYGNNFENFTGVFDDTELSEYTEDEIEEETGD